MKCKSVSKKSPRYTGLVYSPVYHIAIQNDGTNGQIGPEAAGSLVQLIDQRVQAVMLSMRRDGGMLSG
nr:hypothetical protein [Escherichia coli]